MAEIRPFKAWRYSPDMQIDQLLSPLFDVVSDKQRQKLYQNPQNSIHISVPIGENPAQKAAQTWTNWRENGIVDQDRNPAIYVYYQYFSLHNSPKKFCRKGFVAMLRVYDWEEKIVLRHENTIPHSVSDRLELLEKTKLNVSPTHGLYEDTEFFLEKYMDEAIKTPIYETEDYQGIRDILAKIDEPIIVQLFVEKLSEKQIILADGHHRYEASLMYQKKQCEQNPNHTGQEAYNFHLMYFSNTQDDSLLILPTHRLLRNFPDFDEKHLLERLTNYFYITEIDNAEDLLDIICGKKWAFGLILPDKSYKIRLRENFLPKIAWHFPQIVKELDLTVLHYFVFEKIIGIKGTQQRSSTYLHFQRSFTECLLEVNKGISQAAFITNEVSIEDIKNVCRSEVTMPQKSTYFYPKAICGLLFADIS